jgi:hypothetical protein
MNNFNDFLSRFENVRKNGDGYTAKCPSHTDKKNSLSLKAETDKIVLFCHAGCSVNDICASLGIGLKDLFLSANKVVRSEANAQKRIVAVYDYRDETGALLYQKVRFEPKEFRQRKPDGFGGYDYRLKDVRQVPYRLPELIKTLEENPQQTIFLCEGEKDADNLRALGAAASSFKNWKPEFNLFIKDSNIVILTDHDKAGINQAQKAAAIIQSDAKTLKVIDLFEDEYLPEKHGRDVSDWLQLENTRDGLETIVASAPTFEPPSVKIGFTFGELQNLDLKPTEEIIRGLGRGYNGLINAVTNVGKSTLIRNLALCLITGNQFPPLTVTNKPRRVCIIDTEDTLSYLKKDIEKMIAGFSPEEKELINKNLLLICDLPFADEEIRLNEAGHFGLLVNAIGKFQPDLIFIDTISSSFTIRNENDNGEIKERVMKPLKRLARLTDAAVLAAHHIGKSKLEEGTIKENAHKGRGASAFSDQSKVVFNLEQDAKADVILSCGKLKGEKFADTVLVYDKESRWFNRLSETKSVSKYEMILELFADGKSYRRKEIDEKLDGEMGKATITRNLTTAIERGDLIRSQKGLYSANAHLLTPIRDEQMSTTDKLYQNQQFTRNAQMLAPYSNEHMSINGNGDKKTHCPDCEIEMSFSPNESIYFCGFCSLKIPVNDFEPSKASAVN